METPSDAATLERCCRLVNIELHAVALQRRRLRSALKPFDTATPSLCMMRNVGEHADSYAIDHPKRHIKAIDRRQLEVGEWDGTTFRRLQGTDGTSHQLNVDQALSVAEDPWTVLRDTHRAGNIPPNSRSR